MKRITLKELQPLLWQGRYSLRPHAARHAIAEGFLETDIVEVLERGRELAVYLEDKRMLVLGYVRFSPSLQLPLHVVLDYSQWDWLDVVTAFIPDNPYRVVSRERVAILIEHGPRFNRERVVLPKRNSRSKARASFGG